MKNSFELQSTTKIFHVRFDNVNYEVHLCYEVGLDLPMIEDIFREDGLDYVYNEPLLDYINENL